ncbi:probable G-protein coupled receptor 19 [Paramacrobiotus metropolitanus]|uniref:probable G-protein coupled receptor 19 n=1 Tax=Paramacrobiotus metropolitanus TaxID=2943436 RepID=UPI00244572A5|nr:probable G-protein coupled receptor 19 [Paramacrobiotus metropolitanus]
MTFFNNTTAQNASHAASTPPGWTPLLLTSTVIACACFLFNVIVLVVQLLPQTRFTSFTNYLIAISVGNVLWLIGVRPLSIYSAVTGVWPGGYAVCATFSYFQFVESQIPVFVHVLICINRVWAITYPVSYRRRHNFKMAVLSCLAVLAYVHVPQFARFVLEYFYYSPPVKPTDCQPGAGGY